MILIHGRYNLPLNRVSYNRIQVMEAMTNLNTWKLKYLILIHGSGYTNLEAWKPYIMLTHESYTHFEHMEAKPNLNTEKLFLFLIH